MAVPLPLRSNHCAALSLGGSMVVDAEQSAGTPAFSEQTAKQPFNFNTAHTNGHSAASSPASSASTRSSVDYSPRLENTDIADHNHMATMTDTDSNPPIVTENHTQLTSRNTDPATTNELSPTSDESPATHRSMLDLVPVNNNATEHDNGDSTLDNPSNNANQKRKLTVEIPGRSSTSTIGDEPHSSASMVSTDTNPTTATQSQPSLPPAESSSHHYVWMTPSQAKAESKKLKGYRWIPVQPEAVTASTLAVRLVDEKRQRKERNLDKELAIFPQPSTPAVPSQPHMKRDKSGAATPGGRKSAGGQFQEPTPRPQSKASKSLDDPNVARVRALELRLEALKRQQALLRSQSAGESFDMEDEDEDDDDNDGDVRSKKRKAGGRKSGGGEKRRKQSTPMIDFGAINPPLPHTSSTPTAASPGPPSYHASYPQSSPSIVAGGATTPIISKRGRLVRTPSHYTAIEPVSLSAELKRCKTLVDHLMSYKPQEQVFNTPVNYADPSLPFYAVNYLEVIGGPPMDLGTIKTRLVEGGYASLEALADDVRIIWRNAQRYNAEGDWIHTMATEMQGIFETELTLIREQLQREEERKAKRAAERAAAQAAGLPTPSGASSNVVDDYYDPYAFDSNPPSASPISSGFSRGRPPLGRQSSVNSSAIVPPAPRISAGSSKAPLTQKEKHLLKDDIFKLPPQKLGAVLEIIGKDPHHAHVIPADDDEVEIDIDNLQVATLRELQEFVKKTLIAQKRGARPVGAPSPSQQTTPRTSPGSVTGGASPARAMGTPERDITSVASEASPKPLKPEPLRSKYESDSSDEDDEDEPNQSSSSAASQSQTQCSAVMEIS